MKICGIIAEYNPFHEGHAYQLREAKRLSGADALIVVMSGHFVQRGEPAVYDPYTRAESALKAGADVVLMMPPQASTASAEGFASYGVGVLDAIGCDAISCGIEAESGNADTGAVLSQAGEPGDDTCMESYVARLEEIASRLADEDEATGAIIREKLKGGSSYPAALAEAMGFADRPGPNTILALEYLKAMKRVGSDMEFVPVVRVGSGYNDEEIIEGRYPSATALRKKILAGADGYPIGPDDVMPMIIESVRNHADELEDFADCSAQIASRIRNSRLHYKTFEEMVTDLKTRDVTYARIARVLTHILLNIRDGYGICKCSKDAINNRNRDTIGACSQDIANYAQLIGFSNSDALTELNKRCAQKSERFVIISKAADHKDLTESSAYAAEIYNQALWNKYHIEGKDFFRQKILKT